MASVTLTDVRKVYPGPVEAVWNLSRPIRERSLLMFAGSKGSGKNAIERVLEMGGER